MLNRILREPLLHFAIIGALLFVTFELLNPEPQTTADRLVVTEQDIALLEQTYRSTWRRAPNAQERAALIDTFVRQEILVREAEALGLDQNDTIIRQRLQQKMEFLLSSGANAIEPTTEELSDFLLVNQEAYRTPAQLSFAQVYLGQTASPKVVDYALGRLNSGAEPGSVGQRTLLPGFVPLSSSKAVDAAFGQGFANSILALPVGGWAGPVTSGYGMHLIRVEENVTATLPAVDDIREKLEAGWRAARAEELSDGLFEQLRSRYSIEIEASGS